MVLAPPYQAIHREGVREQSRGRPGSLRDPPALVFNPYGVNAILENRLSQTLPRQAFKLKLWLG